MATITKSIGTTGRDYSTLQAWEDAIPADMVAADELWLGECYNDSEFTSGATQLTIDGHTTDSTRYPHLTAAATHSFADNQTDTDPRRLETADGVTITSTTNYAPTISVQDNYVRLSRLQVRQTAGSGGNAVYSNSSNTNLRVQDCILLSGQGGGGGGDVLVFSSGGDGFIAVNTLFIADSSGNSTCIYVRSGTSTLINCSIVRPSTLSAGSSVAIDAYDGVFIIKNTVIANFATLDAVDPGNTTYTTCATTITVSESGVEDGLTYADLFEATGASSAADWKIKAGSGLIDTGTDLSGSDLPAADDCYGTARVAPWDIGFYESGDAGTPQVGVPISDITAGGWTPSTGGSLFAVLDEAAADDADYIQSAIDPATDVAEVRFTSLGTPGGAGAHTIKYRYARYAEGEVNLVVSLVENTTIIATWTHNDIDNAFVTATQTLSGGEIASITDYTNLRLRFTATKV